MRIQPKDVVSYGLSENQGSWLRRLWAKRTKIFLFFFEALNNPYRVRHIL